MTPQPLKGMSRLAFPFHNIVIKGMKPTLTKIQDWRAFPTSLLASDTSQPLQQRWEPEQLFPSASANIKWILRFMSTRSNFFIGNKYTLELTLLLGLAFDTSLKSLAALAVHQVTNGHPMSYSHHFHSIGWLLYISKCCTEFVAGLYSSGSVLTFWRQILQLSISLHAPLHACTFAWMAMAVHTVYLQHPSNLGIHIGVVSALSSMSQELSH